MNMKNIKLIPFLALSLLVAACGGNQPSGSGGGSQESSQQSSEQSSEESSSSSSSVSYAPGQDLIVNVYLDYNHYDPDAPYYRTQWFFDRPFTQEDLGLKDPTKDEYPDPFYGTFLGWSLYTLVDDEANLLKFGEYQISQKEAVGGYINIYGIFVSK